MADNYFTNREKGEDLENLEELEKLYSDWFDDDPEGAEDDYTEPFAKRGLLFKVAAVVVLVTFLAFSFLDLSYLFSGKLGFLNQNMELSEDEIVLLCKPAVVSVEAGTRRGTGFNISPEGTIITNEHVVSGAAKIVVSFGDGRVFHTDAYNVVPNVDIAILNIQGNVKDLPFIELNKVDQVRKGDIVTIIGNPLGFSKISQRGTVGKFYKLADSQAKVFDINIAINPGNSGSPVINSNGQAVGVVFASMSEGEGNKEPTALAIPVYLLP